MKFGSDLIDRLEQAGWKRKTATNQQEGLALAVMKKTNNLCPSTMCFEVLTYWVSSL